MNGGRAQTDQPLIQREAAVRQVVGHPSSSSITTCVIADHWLGATYVSELLKCDPSITLLTLDHVVECIECHNRAPLFIIDYGGLRLPFSQCLIALRRNFAAARYLVMGHDRSQEGVMRIVQLGVDGFITYQHVADDLIRAVHAITAGHVWVEARTLTRLLKSNGRGLLSVDQAVTFRESQILELAKGRLTNKEIGSVLGIQESTVKYHLTNIFCKLGVSGRDDLLDNPDPTGCWKRLLQPTQLRGVAADNTAKYGDASYGNLCKTGT